ncbi:hypothetical protein E3N88_14898 [Mikania micrantha]|uniref:Translation elongation factor P/YeiP central domain-containing protein n=1 Tax=Mikania micrantha TaxID=192012 RepID=A0A5N6P460_9ASTR|nr:hypothetical protein E3N88_14898 [Mikania micrantha]
MRAAVGAAVAAKAKASRISGKFNSSFSSIRGYSIMISTRRNTTTITHSEPWIYSADRFCPPRHLLSVPWSANQIRFAKARGSDVSSFALYALDQEMLLSEKVVKAQHSTQGRGGAIIQVELRDVDSGNKVNERFRTDETVEKIFVEAKSYTYLYTDEESETVVLMEPNTFIQLDVPKHLFGNSLAYLKDDITVSVELFNDRPMSASVPKRVTCTVVEAQVPMKGMGATPHTKKVLLDNGLKVEVPPHIITGDKILIDTTDDSYISRASRSSASSDWCNSMATRSRADLEKTIDEHAVTLLKVDAFMQKSEQMFTTLNANVQAILSKLGNNGSSSIHVEDEDHSTSSVNNRRDRLHRIGRGGGHQKLMVRGGEDRVMAAVIRSMDDYWKLVVVTSYGVKRIRKRKC